MTPADLRWIAVRLQRTIPTKRNNCTFHPVDKSIDVTSFTNKSNMNPSLWSHGPGSHVGIDHRRIGRVLQKHFQSPGLYKEALAGGPSAVIEVANLCVRNSRGEIDPRIEGKVAGSHIEVRVVCRLKIIAGPIEQAGSGTEFLDCRVHLGVAVCGDGFIASGRVREARGSIGAVAMKQ